MEYDVVIATRNRAEVLKVSIPLILEQSRPPRKLIVVDSSDDHDMVHRTVQDITVGSNVALEILRSQKACSANQRNLGIERVESPVVMFPDDDSLWWPGVGEAIMRIYERDKNGDIGGVCAREITIPPPGLNLPKKNIYKMSLVDRIRQKIGRPRHIFDDFVCPDPLWIHGRSCWNVRPVPDWLSTENAALVEFSGAARMSLRTDIIRKNGFDEDLGLYTGWAAYEDADISFKVMRNHLFVGAHNARAYHYKCPGQRANGFVLGFILLFNRAYIICCYSPPNSRARAMLKRFALYKALQYLLDAGSKFGRERLKGTLTAIKKMKCLLDVPADFLRQRYLEICREVLGEQKNKDTK